MKARAIETESDRAVIREDASRISKASGVAFQDALDLLLIHNIRKRHPGEEPVWAGMFEFERNVHARDEMRAVTRRVLVILGARTEDGKKITSTTKFDEIAGQKVLAPITSRQ